jgi:hypothetical protein
MSDRFKNPFRGDFRGGSNESNLVGKIFGEEDLAQAWEALGGKLFSEFDERCRKYGFSGSNYSCEDRRFGRAIHPIDNLPLEPKIEVIFLDFLLTPSTDELGMSLTIHLDPIKSNLGDEELAKNKLSNLGAQIEIKPPTSLGDINI